MTASAAPKIRSPRRNTPFWPQVRELLSSMRFAIALLTVICIASVIGTVIQQHESPVSYVNQFGPFWSELFLALKLNAVYSAWWFLLILAFLVVSTTLCVMRHTPKYLADMRNYKENIREQSLKAFGHKAEAHLSDGNPEANAHRIGEQLVQRGWKVRLQERPRPEGKGWMVAAKIGSANKIGYIAAHSAIVLICLGGLLDGDLFVRALTWLGGKSVYTGGGLVSEVKAEHRLPSNNPTFRGNLLVTEGTRSATAILSQSDGVLLQELPFAVELKRFIVEYYSTGMPKLFASDIVIHDLASDEQIEARVEVNHPVVYKGVHIYQSSFDDGGSEVTLKALPLDGGSRSFEISGRIGTSANITNGNERYTLEYTNLNLINVENLADARRGPVDVRRVDLRQMLDDRLGAADKTATERQLRNIGPSVTYKLRDEAGQAREFHNYMVPVDMGDATSVFLLGVRDTQAESFRYLRVPEDEKGSMEGFVHLRSALLDAQQRELAIQRYVLKATGFQPGQAEIADQLALSATRVLDLFWQKQDFDGLELAGLQAVSRFIEQAVPEAERERAAEVLLRILNGTLFELNQQVRQQHGKAPLDEAEEQTRRFMTQSVLALADAPFYPAPLVFQLDSFEHVQASVFQVARAPGKYVVYLGCLLLIIGVFAMLYVRERRLWVWLSPDGDSSQARMALSANRKTLAADQEFEQLKTQLLSLPPFQSGDLKP